MWEGCLVDVGRLFGGHGQASWMVLGGCLKGKARLSGCRKAICRVSGGFLKGWGDCIDGVGRLFVVCG